MKNKQKRLLVLLLSIALVISVLCLGTAATSGGEIVEEPECYEHGDVNGDGVIDRRDAVYVLYYFYWPDRYPSKQDFDFQKDDKIDRRDAVYLLYASFGLSSNYKLKGTVHSYYDPVWVWDTASAEVTAKVTFKCGCGEEHTVTTQDTDGVTVTAGTVTEATCVAAGSKPYSAQVVYDGKTYTSTTAVTIPANEGGHNMVGTQGCETSSQCSRCDYNLPALGHNWEQTGTVAATCTANAKLVYTCSGCGDTKEVEQEGTAGCKNVYYGEKQGANEYQFIKQYQCSVCQTITDGETYCKHNYTAKITLEATCSAKGSKTLTCSACGDVQTEEIPQNDSHTWVKGNTTNNATEYTCACGATKSVVEVAKNEAVPATALKDNELQLENNTSVTLDESTANQLDTNREIVISVEEVDVSNIDMSENEKAQVGDNAVYDFSMKYDNGDPITDFDGFVTVRLPYTLQDGDDADSIDVWYIADDGSVECVKGVYSNDYVTFQTDHFSYYTVTRLTPAQRCSVYGHINVTKSKAATCTADGYTTVYCQRCGHVESNVAAPMLGHDYQTVENTAASCEVTGLLKEQCGNCSEIKSTVLPALGHDMKADEKQSSAASCTAPGKNVSVCSRGCGHKTEEELPQLEHDYKLSETVKASCGENGYEKYVCEHCDAEEKRNETAAHGHKWNAENAAWQWNEDHTKATVTLTCSHNNSHTKALTAVVTKKDEGNACLGGNVTYTATASYNQVTYTDSVSDKQDGPGHTPDAQWSTDDAQHFHLCTVCGEPVGKADHTWGEPTVVTPATCTKSGKGTAKCTVCNKEKEVTLPATGEHSFVNGVCSDCGFVEGSCTHRKRNATKVDLTQYGVCGGYIVIRSCDCGQVSYVDEWSFDCDFESTEGKDPETGYWYSEADCPDCGLVAVYSEYMQGKEENCTGQWVQTINLTVGDTEIIHSEYAYHTFQHPVVCEKEISLSDYGMCGGTVTVETCYCGLRSYYYNNNEEGETTCSWTAGTAENQMVCSVCNTVATHIGSIKKDGCFEIETSGTTYSRNGVELCTVADVYAYGNHNYTLVEKEIYGDSCEDGLYLVQTCADCGYTTEGYFEYHTTAQRTKIDTSNTGFCTDTIVQFSCLCGASQGYEMFNSQETEESRYHNWTEVESSNTNEIYECDNCGYTMTVTRQSSKGENCMVTESAAQVYTDDEGHKFTTVYKETYEEHDYERSFELKGNSCEDGVTEVRTCTDCGYSHEWEYDWHSTYPVETYDLSEYGFCGGTISLYRCACGQENYRQISENHCNWEPKAGDENFHENQCATCGIVWQSTWAEDETTEPCCIIRNFTHTYLKDGKTLCTIKTAEREYYHRYVYEMQLSDGATTCEDGYTYTRTCVTCGEQNESQGMYSGCWTRPVARENISAEGMCGELEKVTYSCACGKEGDTYFEWADENNQCYYDNSEWSDELDCWIYTCGTCGSKYAEKSSSEPVEGTTCQYLETSLYTYWGPDGQEICSYEETWTSYNHEREIYTYSLNGATCADGYSFTATCLTCGEQRTGHSSGNCWTRPVAREIISTEDMCGQLEMISYSCACGAESSTEIQWTDREVRCYYNGSQWSEELDSWLYTCNVCGSKRANKGEYIPVEGTTCEYLQINRETYFAPDGQELGTCEDSWTSYDHTMIYSFILQGETCQDGYTWTAACAECGEVWSTDEPQYGCSTEVIARELICETSCGPVYLYTCSCACGDNFRYDRSDDCQWNHIGYEDGVETYKCSVCGLTRKHSQTSRRVAGSCLTNEVMEQTYILDGQTIGTVSKSWTEYSHIYIHTFQLQGETCQDGYVITSQCAFCDKSYSGGTEYSDHDMYRTDYFDLPEGSCGGYGERYGCACGENSSIQYSLYCDYSYDYREEADESGIMHYYETRSCDDCGMVMERESYDMPGEDACHGRCYKTCSWKMGDWERTLTSCVGTESHSYETVSAELMVGSQTCEDGVKITDRCAVCGETNTYTTSYHEQYVVESVDLAQYGAVCGGSLNLTKCACGAYQGYEFSGDTLCDLDEKSTDGWIEEEIDDSQWTAEGYVSVWSHSYIYTCAVTDPDCDLKIRMSYYWLKGENCTAVQYVTWQLGYDEETGTCQKELTVPTGRTQTWHDYDYTYERQEQGVEGSFIDVYQYLCPDCGSSYTEKNHYVDSFREKYEEIAINTLNNGERQRRSRTITYVNHQGYNFTTLDREEYVYADGSTYWSQTEYTYDDWCRPTSIYTNSYGEREEQTYESHWTGWEYITTKESTCTQFGSYIQQEICRICDKITEEYTYQTNPSAHEWWWSDDMGTYVCSYCGLESQNGASGDIVLEDLTDSYTNGNYVIGYWNRGNVSFNPYVSLILYDVAEGENDELVLTDINFTYLTVSDDGICGLSFDQEAVTAAAATALEESGYTGEYAVRISFVPATGSDTLDYAITFETLMAE